MKHIAIVGAGIIGLTIATELQKRGHEITLIDENTDLAGASTINAGWIVPAMSAPIPAPGVVTQSIKWLLKADAPLSLTIRPNFEFMRWMLGFARACSAEQFARGFEIMSELNEETLVHLDRLIADGLVEEHRADGLLYSFKTEASLQHELAILEKFRPAGYRNITPLKGDELQELESSLSTRNVSGFLLQHERSVRPESMISGLLDRLNQSDFRHLVGKKVTGITQSGKRVDGVRIGEMELAADGVIVASGVGIRKLLRTVGVRVPIESGQGYSLTWPTNGPRPTRPVYLHDDRIAITPFEGAIRASGTMHLGRTSGKLDRRKIRAIARATRASFTSWPDDTGGLSVASGMRPVTPDGLPVIGRTAECENLFVAGGHAMLGMTLAPVTAFELANLIETGVPSDRIAPLSPTRFK